MSGTARWKGRIEQGVGEGAKLLGTPLPVSAPLSPHVRVVTNLSTLSPFRLYRGVLTQACSIKPLAIGDGFNLQAPSPPSSSGAVQKPPY